MGLEQLTPLPVFPADYAPVSIPPQPLLPYYSASNPPTIVPSFAPASHSHSSLLAASLEAVAFEERRRDPQHAVLILPPRRNDLPAAHAVHAISHLVSFWCSRCRSWIQSNSKNVSKYGAFTKHVESPGCLAHYAQILGLSAPLFPGSCVPLDITAGFSSVANTHRTCPGIIVPWKDEIWDTYVWHQHASSSWIQLPWVVELVDARGQYAVIHARSRQCKELGDSPGSACSACLRLLPKIEEKYEAATHPKKGSNYDRRDFRGLLGLAHLLADELAAANRKLETLVKHCEVIERKADDWSDLLTTLSSNNIPRLDHMLRLSIKRRWSPRAIRDSIVNALSKTYRASKQYSPREISAGLLSYCIGGSRLTFALSKAFGTPSLRTLKALLNGIVIKPCLRGPDDPTMCENLVNVVQRLYRKLPPVLCHLAVDESTLVACAMYMRLHNSIGGCCGKKSAANSAGLFEQFFRVWEASGLHRRLGWFASIATDGDSSRRRGGYFTLLKQEVDPNGDLYKMLVRMQGMNLYVGPHDVTLDFDWKHIIKRMSTCIRGKEGMMIRHHVITPALLGTYLKRIGFHENQVHSLLEPDDAQNVISAIELINALKKIKKTLRKTTHDAADRQNIKAIRTFAHVYGSFVQAFTDHTLSLSEQMTLLSTYSHLATVIYRSDKQHFISSQLYADSQTCVKNMFFCLAKQQIRDPSQRFYLFMKGSDGVERLFAMMRMIGGHKPNVNLLELCQNLGRGMDIQRIFAEHPEWYSGHRRLSTSRGDKADHLSVRDWMGDVIAGNAPLEKVWNDGAAAADEILKEAGFPAAERNFCTIFADKDTDILRPLGDGIYVGVPSVNSPDEPDRSLNPSVTLDASGSTRSETCTATTDSQPADDVLSPEPEDDDSDTESDLGEEEEEALRNAERINAEAARLQDEADTEMEEMPESLTEMMEVLQDEEGDDGDGDEEDEPLLCSSEQAQRVKGQDDAHYVLFEGRQLHKATVIRVILNSSYNKKQSKDRLVRVRIYSDGAGTAISGDGDPMVLPSDMFAVGDCFATPVRSAPDISLAIMQCTHIYRFGKPVSQVARADVPQPEAQITLKGQILSFVQVHGGLAVTPMSTVKGENAGGEVGREMWMWDNETVRLRPVKKNARANDIPCLTVHGFTALPLTPSNAVVSLATFTPPAEPDPDADGSFLTWTYSYDELAQLLSRLWEVLKAPTTLAKLARCGVSAGFPYRALDESFAFAVAVRDAKKAVQNLEKCAHCARVISETARLDHVGRHLLLRRNKVVEKEAGAQTVIDTCGFCGRSDNPLCQQLMLKESPGRGTTRILSSCPSFYPARYGSASKSSASRPSTNVPIVCKICFPDSARDFTKPCLAKWKYEMDAHIRRAHPDYSTPTHPASKLIPIEMAATLDLGPQEEEWIGVPKTTPWTQLGYAVSS